MTDNFLFTNESNFRNKHLIALLVLNFVFIFLLNEFSVIIFGEAMIDNQQKISGETSSFLLFLPWIIGPVKEELKYRWILGNYNFNATIGSIAILMSDIIVTIIMTFVLENNLHFYNYYIFIVILSLLVFVILKKNQEKLDIRLFKFYSSHYKYIFVISIVLFALWHILFNKHYQNIPIITILLIYILNGFILSYVRIRLGLLQATFYHFVYNLPFMMLYL
jgi:membrane protease YdiL (CAAX protease family)